MRQFLLTLLLGILAAMLLAAVAGCCQPDPCRDDARRAERSASYHQPQPPTNQQ